MKKNSLWVCVRVKVQRSKKHHSSIKCFAMQFSSNKVSRGWEFSQSSSDQLGIPPIRFPEAPNSANQVPRSWEFHQSGFAELAIQPIRF